MESASTLARNCTSSVEFASESFAIMLAVGSAEEVTTGRARADRLCQHVAMHQARKIHVSQPGGVSSDQTDVWIDDKSTRFWPAITSTGQF